MQARLQDTELNHLSNLPLKAFESKKSFVPWVRRSIFPFRIPLCCNSPCLSNLKKTEGSVPSWPHQHYPWELCLIIKFLSGPECLSSHYRLWCCNSSNKAYLRGNSFQLPFHKAAIICNRHENSKVERQAGRIIINVLFKRRRVLCYCSHTLLLSPPSATVSAQPQIVVIVASLALYLVSEGKPNFTVSDEWCSRKQAFNKKKKKALAMVGKLVPTHQIQD